MATVFDTYEKKKEFLVCVDSDGCAMDTMDIKHYRCFGPCMVTEWGLEEWAEPILSRWNDINLYTMTRGINRFKGLAMALKEIDQQYKKIEDLDKLVDWTDHANELSNSGLTRMIEADPACISFQKALAWSKAVNASITLLPEEVKQPFAGAKEALAFAHQVADIAIVSSANPDAVIEEWKHFGLLEHTDIMCAQDAGTKAYCIAQLLKKGYDPEKVLMCGDAPGDMDAAKKNGVLYFPILVRHEKESWDEFIAAGCNKLVEGTYKGEYQEARIAAFLQNLGG